MQPASQFKHYLGLVTRSDNDANQETNLSMVNNNFVPFLSLPNEILVQIISLLLCNRDTHLCQLEILSLICRLTHELINGTSSLHSYIDTHFDYFSLTCELARSGSTPLDVVIYLSGGDHLDRKLTALADTVQRWRTVDIQNPFEFSPGVQMVTQQPAPTLQTVDLFGLVDPTHTPTLFAGVLPKLKVLTVSDCHLPWRSIQLPKLRKLVIRRPKGLTPGALRSILVKCRELEHLHIQRFRALVEEENTTGSRSPSDTIHLPFLVDLCLKRVAGSIACRIIPFLSAPLMRHLEIDLLTLPEETLSYGPTIWSLLRMARATKTNDAWQRLQLPLVQSSNAIAIRIPDCNSVDPRSQLISIQQTSTPLALSLLVEGIDEIFPEVTIDFENIPGGIAL